MADWYGGIEKGWTPTDNVTDWWSQKWGTTQSEWQKLLDLWAKFSAAKPQNWGTQLGALGAQTPLPSDVKQPYPIYPEAYGAAPLKETGGLLAEGQVVIPGQLILLPDGSYVDYNGVPVNSATAQKMLNDYIGSTTEEERMTAFEQAQLQLQTQQLDLQKQQWLAGLMANPRDWIQRWYAQNLPQGERKNIRGETQTVPQMMGAYQARQNMLQGLSPEQVSQKAYGAITGLQEGRAALKGEALTPEEMRGAVSDWLLRQLPAVKEKKKVGAPPVPEWLPQFAPELAGQKRLKEATVVTPSLQKWATVPWSQREGLAGYMDWAGSDFQGMLEQMALMAPKTPVTARGWRTARQ